MKYQRGDVGVTLMIVMMVLMMGFFTLRGHHGTGMHHVAENVQTGAAEPPPVVAAAASGAMVEQPKR